ncbi:hypothetical protein [Rhizobium sp.]|uniref:YobI family P-loop NTPase n=1 Tax=Rhizobium sp. TaxID=391 RepID=UPI00289AC898
MELFHFIRRCFCFTPKASPQTTKFIDLAPVGSADEKGIYFEALDFATNNPAVLNIALTGPYGSGKSSVIQSFVSSYRIPPLQLSLASFMTGGEEDEKATKQEIERSILQQILYGANANKIPLSRFKRIQTPSKWSALNSLFLAFGIYSVWYLLNKQSAILSGDFFKPADTSNWFNFICFGVAAAFVWASIHSLYLKSLGLSLKSISLKDIQIAPAASDSESILNRHLDEIIYFFQSTKYDLVVIEDLDRFNDPNIFVTLREINGLVNGNPGINRPIRFLYALRDDILKDTERTKFFEFIIPVIPVINHSNSIDKVLEQSQRIKLDERLDRQFIRDVSRYLSDMRLIRNIFNEYVVYAANLNADDDLNPTKLLAVLIYKNVLPHDFAALHREEGAVKRVLDRYDEYVAKIESEIRSEIAAVEAGKLSGDAQSLRDYSELCKVYAMAIVERMPPHHDRVLHDTVPIHLAQLAQDPNLEGIIRAKTTMALSLNGNRAAVDLTGLQESVDPTRSFIQRKADIERKSVTYRETADNTLRELRARLASLRIQKFNEVVRESAELVEDVFADVGHGSELLRFLILEGYLDDTYYQYTSLFHSGRLSPNDNKYLIQIRSYKNPEPDFQLDNVAEVISSMRDADFHQRYVLNTHIVDKLLEDPQLHAKRIKAACSFISTRFHECGEFFKSYYARGVNVGSLIETLSREWSNFPEVALQGSEGASHAARILAFAPTSILSTRYSKGSVSHYISANTRLVLSERFGI